ncbi:hypothetical protein N7452_009407 [Penicillium brevicompactum]|uniref:Uncharacterized protein n=1 Tax=Penicillium brevicompactum TaxID=5074 RepID=A0A9W9QD57_PENBR|nr:hypothetical protein N7452_009407 [Penicillium brevicompactum]
MELHKPSHASSRSGSATFPLSHSSSHRESPDTSSRSQASDDRQTSPRSQRGLAQPAPTLTPSQEGRRHKHSKSRELRFPRQVSHLASASARGLLPTWSSKDKDQVLLRPEGRWGSESTVSRRGSLVEERLGPVRGIQSLGDLEKVKNRRKTGEEYLRSALTSIGTLATDATRRLDYTYYNLLEKITALNSTISSFQELSDSASTLLNDFERETTGLDQDIRKQINDLQGFQPQVEKADALEQRMKAGQQRVEELGKRLETVRHEIDSWERRETEWQTKTTRRLRIWGIVLGAVVVLVLALAFQQNHMNRNAFRDPQRAHLMDSVSPVGSGTGAGPTFPPILADRRQSLARAGPTPTPTMYDPLRVLDEL